MSHIKAISFVVTDFVEIKLSWSLQRIFIPNQGCHNILFSKYSHFFLTKLDHFYSFFTSPYLPSILEVERTSIALNALEEVAKSGYTWCHTGVNQVKASHSK